MREFILAAVVFCALLLTCPAINAEENPFSVKVKVRYSQAVDVADQPGDFEYAKIVGRIGYNRTLGNGRPFYINIGPDHHIFDEDTSVPLPAQAKSRGIRTGTEFDLPFQSDDSDLFGIELNPTFQSTNTFGIHGDTFRFNFSTYFKYNGADDFSWKLGAVIRPGYNMPVLPIFGINYRVTDKLFINLVSDDPNISYHLTEKTSLSWDFDYTFDEFEHFGGTYDGAILQLQDFATGVGVKHQFNEHIAASLGVGGVLNRIIKYDGNRGKIVPDDALYMSGGLQVAF